VWNGTNWIQKNPPNVPPGRYGETIVYDAAHGQVVMFGGVSLGAGVVLLSDTWVWDGANWTQKYPTNIPAPRWEYGMAYDVAHRQVVMFGGAGNGAAADTWIWDGENWTQKSPATVPIARYGHTMAYDAAHGQVVMFGGGAANGAGVAYLNDTWLWMGQTGLRGIQPTARPRASFRQWPTTRSTAK